MDVIERCTRQLIEAMKDSRQVQRFERAKAAVAADGERRERIDGYRRQVYGLMSREDSDALLVAMGEMGQVRDALWQDPLTAEYLEAELDVCRLVQEICCGVMNVTDLELEGLRDLLHG